nr:MAG TPA: hypothetical protein [Caudoviricetes sp.]
MIKVENILEYKRAGDPEWRFVYATRDYDIALTRFESAKTSIPDAAEIRIRVKVTQSQIAEEWRKDND